MYMLIYICKYCTARKFTLIPFSYESRSAFRFNGAALSNNHETHLLRLPES